MNIPVKSGDGHHIKGTVNSPSAQETESVIESTFSGVRIQNHLQKNEIYGRSRDIKGTEIPQQIHGLKVELSCFVDAINDKRVAQDINDA